MQCMAYHCRLASYQQYDRLVDFYPALITPTIQSFVLARGLLLGSVLIPKASGNDRLAPFEPVWSHPLKNSERGPRGSLKTPTEQLPLDCKSPLSGTKLWVDSIDLGRQSDQHPKQREKLMTDAFFLGECDTCRLPLIQECLRNLQVFEPTTPPS